MHGLQAWSRHFADEAPFPPALSRQHWADTALPFLVVVEPPRGAPYVESRHRRFDTAVASGRQLRLSRPRLTPPRAVIRIFWYARPGDAYAFGVIKRDGAVQTTHAYNQWIFFQDLDPTQVR